MALSIDFSQDNGSLDESTQQVLKNLVYLPDSALYTQLQIAEECVVWTCGCCFLL